MAKLSGQELFQREPRSQKRPSPTPHQKKTDLNVSSGIKVDYCFYFAFKILKLFLPPISAVFRGFQVFGLDYFSAV